MRGRFLAHGVEEESVLVGFCRPDGECILELCELVTVGELVGEAGTLASTLAQFSHEPCIIYIPCGSKAWFSDHHA